MSERFQIVLAWLVSDFVVAEERRRDLGERPVLKEIKVPKAAMWIKDGQASDLRKAEAYAKKETDNEIFIFTYNKAEKDPLGKAKKEVAKHS